MNFQLHYDKCRFVTISVKQIKCKTIFYKIEIACPFFSQVIKFCWSHVFSKGNYVPKPSKKLQAVKQFVSTHDDCEKRNYELFHKLYDGPQSF